MSAATTRLLGAVALLALAGWLGDAPFATGGAGRDGTSAGERDADTGSDGPTAPLARALRPLGPIKAVLSSLLWSDLMRSQQAGDGERIASLATALLALHPDLDAVREHLAYQLIVSEARRAPDRGRHRLLVSRGLQILEEGLDAGDPARLHATAGRLLYDRRERDPWFPRAVERTFGDTPDELAIEHLRRARPVPPLESLILASLLVERGVRVLVTDADTGPARRDLDEATAVLADSTVGADERGAVLRPLQELLELADAGEDPRLHDPFRDRWLSERRRELLEPEEP